jgi:gas vesicle protein
MLYHKKDEHVAGKVIGAGIIGALIGAVAGVFFSPKSGKENREDMKAWMSDMQDEITARAKDAKDLTQEKYDVMVDEISNRYKSMSKTTSDEWAGVVKEMKKHWSRINKEWEDSNR